nr:plastocyanin precursor [Prochlorothrix hollandica]prf//2107183A plastocyanin [Prochlorothrix hollandica]
MKFFASLSKRFAPVLSLVVLVAGTLLLSAAPASAATVQIKMGTDKYAPLYEPKALSISAGDTVEFVMNKVGPHNVIFDKVPAGESAPALSNTKLRIAPGSFYSVTLGTPGTYSFYCTPHRGAGMVGTITVE